MQNDSQYSYFLNSTLKIKYHITLYYYYIIYLSNDEVFDKEVLDHVSLV